MNSQLVSSITSIASIMPMVGDSTMAISVLLSPPHFTPVSPAWATPEPIMPPTSAWLDDDGMPFIQVTTFQNIAPISAPNTTAGVMKLRSISPWPIVSATLCRLGKAIVRK